MYTHILVWFWKSFKLTVGIPQFNMLTSKKINTFTVCIKHEDILSLPIYLFGNYSNNVFDTTNIFWISLLFMMMFIYNSNIWKLFFHLNLYGWVVRHYYIHFVSVQSQIWSWTCTTLDDKPFMSWIERARQTCLDTHTLCILCVYVIYHFVVYKIILICPKLFCIYC